MANILILIGGHLCTSPRSQKEAETLATAGHDVTVGGFWFDPTLIERDRLLMANKQWKFVPIVDFQPTHCLTNWRIRLQTRLAKERYRCLKHFSPDLLGYGARFMLSAARQTGADLTIVHSEVGLWVGSQLLNEGFQVGVDFEDWFSEDLPLEARTARPIFQLKALEAQLMRDCKYCLTTSHAMADAMATAYNAPRPTVIYNSFLWAEREQIDHQTRDRKDLTLPSLHWFSQTIGPGRGLELLFQSLPYLKIPVEIHLRGNYPESSRQWLEPLVPHEWRDRLFIHSTVPNAELLSRIAEHDIGLALESPKISSRDLTVTNKLFQYLQAGLAVIATDTAGQQEIFSRFPGIGCLISHKNPQALAAKITALLSQPEQLANAKAVSLQATQTKFCWEIQAGILTHKASSAFQFKVPCHMEKSMVLKEGFSDLIVSQLHKVSALRLIAKKFLKGHTLQQSFHEGVICLDAVEHSWAWTGSRRYETFDDELQSKLLSLSQNYSLLIDIGSNIGAMSLSVLLRNPDIKAICIDPNSRAITLLEKSISLNKLTSRVELINAAVCNTNGVITFDENGSVTGHISPTGRQVPAIQFTHLINEYSTQKCLVKVDIEGFETSLLPYLSKLHHLPNLCLVMELHPLGFNEVGNPAQCLEFLLNSGAIVSDLNGHALSHVKNEDFTQIVACWLYE